MTTALLAPYQKKGSRIKPDDFLPTTEDRRRRQTPEEQWQVGQAFLDDFRRKGGIVLTDPGF